MKWNTPFPSLSVSYDIKIYSSTPGLAGRDLNPFCSHAGALKKSVTQWERVCNKPPATAAGCTLRYGLAFYRSHLCCLISSHPSVLLCNLCHHRRAAGKYVFSRIFKHHKSIQSRGVFCQDCVLLKQRQIGFHNRPAQGTSRNGA